MTSRSQETDQIVRYNQRQMRRFIMAGLAILKPAAVRQMVHQIDGVPTNQFRLLVDQLIRKYCSRFVERLQKWAHYFDRTHDLLFCMIYYHEIWEGFPESEPWHNSRGKPITYFLDINYERRVREMDALFDY